MQLRHSPDVFFCRIDQNLSRGLISSVIHLTVWSFLSAISFWSLNTQLYIMLGLGL